MEYKAGKFARSLRLQLFREHLGLLDDNSDVDVIDVVHDSVFNKIWKDTSRLNTEIYDEVKLNFGITL